MALVRRNERSPSVPSLFGNVWNADPFRVMEEFFGREGLERYSRAPEAYVPSVEVKETPDSYLVKADLPGVKMEDVKVTLAANVLRIEGHRQEEKREEKDRFHLTERTYGGFARTFALPDGTDSEGVVADMKDGVLTVTIPKRPEQKPRHIPIGGAGRKS